MVTGGDGMVTDGDMDRSRMVTEVDMDRSRMLTDGDMDMPEGRIVNRRVTTTLPYSEPHSRAETLRHGRLLLNLYIAINVLTLL